MRHLHTDIRIAASKECVWDILTDFDAYPRWNPFIRSIEGELEPGRRLRVRLKLPGAGVSTVRPRLTTVKPASELRWLGSMGMPGIFDADHRFLIERAGEHAVLFQQEEHVSGAAVPLLWKGLDRHARRGFEQMNSALKQLAEQTERRGRRAAES